LSIELYHEPFGAEGLVVNELEAFIIDMDLPGIKQHLTAWSDFRGLHWISIVMIKA
jgi:hypothetical protein